ncbi:hypothetical protein ABZ299_09455, partial [Streptomyces sp. NPDC006184]
MCATSGDNRPPAADRTPAAHPNPADGVVPDNHAAPGLSKGAAGAVADSSAGAGSAVADSNAAPGRCAGAAGAVPGRSTGMVNGVPDNSTGSDSAAPDRMTPADPGGSWEDLVTAALLGTDRRAPAYGVPGRTAPVALL